MLELNKVMLVGNLTRDPELNFLPSGTALAKMGLALNRRYKSRDGEQREETAFVDVEAWGSTAEFCQKWLKKGRRVYVEGRLKQDRWEAQDGSKRSKLLVSAERVQFADGKQDAGGQQNYDDDSESGGPAPQRQSSSRPAQQAGPAPQPFPEPADDGGDTDDDLPF